MRKIIKHNIFSGLVILDRRIKFYFLKKIHFFKDYLDKIALRLAIFDKKWYNLVRKTNY